MTTLAQIIAEAMAIADLKVQRGRLLPPPFNNANAASAKKLEGQINTRMTALMQTVQQYDLEHPPQAQQAPAMQTGPKQTQAKRKP